MRVCAILLCLAAASSARESAGWNAARTAHFEVYSDASAATAELLVAHLERLHGFFLSQIGLSPAPRYPVRVICFASAEEYAQYRTRPGADAYFVGTESRDYIVLPAPGRGNSSGVLRTVAHEYAHVLMHSGRWKLPEWIAEGVSDVVSTVQLRDRAASIGGDLPGRSAVLKTGKWLPLAELFAFRPGGPAPDLTRTGLFYAESWAIADLLMLSPAYSARFAALLAALASGVPAERAIAEVYGVAASVLERDARARVTSNTQSVALRAVAGSAGIRVEAVTPFASRAMLADLHFVNGELARAESLYRALARERPAAAEVYAALGTIALGRGDTGTAVAEWKRAIDLGIADASLCFRYAALADERGLPARAPLERAIALRPDFDDARFKLALMEKNAGHAEAAILQLRAMRRIAPARAFAWWSALADALLDLNRRGEAKQAAAEALAKAANGEERERAAQLDWLADTELAIEMEGQKFRTVRVPIGGAARNPFIEPGDRAKRTEATLREIECAENGGDTRLIVDTAQGPLTLAVPNPSRVEIRNVGGAAFEFTCGPQEGRKVVVEYASSSLVLRGLELR